MYRDGATLLPAVPLRRGDVEGDISGHFAEDLHGLSSNEERIAAIDAMTHGYIEGREGGYGQPGYLSEWPGGAS